MKKVLKYLFLAVLVFTIYQLGLVIIKRIYTNDEKQTLISEHFNVYFHQVSSWDAENIAYKLENNFRRITEDLLAQTPPKIHVYIHPNKMEFYHKVGFDAYGAIKGIDTFHLLYTRFPVSWIMPMEEIAVHEFTHNITLQILVHEAISKGEISSIQGFDSLYSQGGKRFDEIYPRWIWESIAVYEARQHNLFSLYMSLKDGFPNLKTLNEPNNLVYNVGYTLIDFVIKRWGKDKLIALLKNNGDVGETLGLTDKEFERQWELFVKDKFWIL